MRAGGVRTTGWFAAAFAVAVAVSAIAARGAAAAPSLSVNVEKTTIFRNEQLTVDVVTSGDYDEISGPTFEGFEILGRSEGRSFSFGMGGSRSERTITLTLAPERTGRLVIGAARLMQDGRVVASSRPVEITVRDEDAPVTRQRQGRRSGMMSLFPQIAVPQIETVKPPELEARLSGVGAPVFPGQPLVLEYVLVTPMPPEYWSVAVTAKPAMDGLVVREAPRGQEQSAQIDRPDGTWYETVIWKAAVTPIESGTIKVDPMRLEAGFRGVQSFSINSDPLVIEVSPLPDAGTPDGFVPGTVGNFRMDAKLENSEIAVGESATLSVTISGRGNVAAIREPAVRVDRGIRVDPFANSQAGDEIAVDDEGLSGSKTFRFLLTAGKLPEGTGRAEFRVGVAPLVFFDAAGGRWGTAAADEMTLTVVEAGLREAAERKPVPALGILETSSLADPPRPNEPWLTSARLVALMTVPVLLLAALELFRHVRVRLNRQGSRGAARKALRRAMAELARLDSAAGVDETTFWTSLETVLRTYVAARFDVSTAALTHPDIASAVSEAGAGREAADELLNLLEHCSIARFARQESSSDHAAVLAKARGCIGSLDRTNGGVS